MRRAPGGGLAAAFAVMLVAGAVQAAPAAAVPVDPSGRDVAPTPVGPAEGSGDEGPGAIPEGLTQALERDLDLTPDQYLASADAAAKASDILPQLEGAGIDPADVWLDDTTINVHVSTPEEQQAAADAGATPTVAEPPAAPDLSRRASAYADLLNGTGWTQNGVLCSTGFNGFTASNARSVATAGHCLLADGPAPGGTITASMVNQTGPNQGGAIGAVIGPLDQASFRYGNGNDGGLIMATNAAVNLKPATSTWNGSTVPVRGMITATVGAPICKSGRTTGWTCGKVLAVNYQQEVGDASGRITTVNSVATSMCMYHGDSGGAAMIGTYAVGINSSGAWTTAQCTDTDGFSAVYPLQGSSQSFTATHPGWRLALNMTTARVAGADRSETSVQVSKQAYPSGASVVYVANGWNFPDALVTGPAAVTQNGPVLLAPLAAGLPKSVADEIRRLKATRIVVVGGAQAISAGTEHQLRTIVPNVSRIAGGDRYDTARKLVASVYKTAGIANLYVASGIGFPDSLAASAAGASDGSPVLTVPGSNGAVDTATLQAIQRLKPQKITIVGGTASVSAGIAKQLAGQAKTVRVGGATRWETSQLLAKAVFPNGSTMLLANGVGFADALAGSVLAGKKHQPLLITQQGCVERPVLNAMASWQTQAVTLIGGTASLGTAVQGMRAC
ncbi:cell wall-binding repeat-containing protein [Leifsonia sp. F6_8S_P_1B]|uniref:Cell wall-binding repeat-containing protein n=1 Tax=Leifsonia williamsii TaxID=3035919 RepID=A0ABT8KHW6_9MICO|nr:cell wall-binding repeat-containing protein [Leifsonia williamsii]MDN4615914.1 cell wall-binding repeat-containing protein [Leifsonia williamsii]